MNFELLGKMRKESGKPWSEQKGGSLVKNQRSNRKVLLAIKDWSLAFSAAAFPMTVYHP